MSPVYEVYSRDDSIAEFFTRTCTTRASCESKALELVGGSTVVPVEVQGVCSYTVYAGPKLEYVVQFRLKSLKLELEIATLARQIYGSLAPSVQFHGEFADNDESEKEPLLVYVMERMKGISHLGFVLAHGFPEDSVSHLAARRNMITGIARFMALSWNAPQEVSSEYRDTLRRGYISDLQFLLVSLPERFHNTIQRCLDQMDSVFSLPMVLLHRDFGTSNVLVDESCHLTGVIDWAEAEICPFGQNLHSLEAFTGEIHLQNGWRQYGDYEDLQLLFWSTFGDEIGFQLSPNTKKAIETSRIMALLLSRGFTPRLANLPEPTPISDNDAGRYNMMYLDGFLIEPTTKFIEL